MGIESPNTQRTLEAFDVLPALINAGRTEDPELVAGTSTTRIYIHVRRSLTSCHIAAD